MTKYMDLLREHETKREKPSNAKVKKDNKKKKAKKATKPSQNPYSNQQESDDALLDSIDGLLEEQESFIPEGPAQLDDGNLLLDEAEDDTSPQENAESTSELVELDETAQESNESQGIKPALDLASQTFNIATWLENMNAIMGQVFSAAQHEDKLDLTDLHEYLRLLIDQVEADHRTLDKLELEINRHVLNVFDDSHKDADLIQKAIMMMLYTIKVGLQLKLQHQELLPHTEAAMLHHIGMAMVPCEIRQKRGKLTKKEIQTIRQAPEKALAYLESQDVNEQVLLAVAQAPERYDGSGPQGLTGHEIAWIARLVGLLSIFEALIHFRPYRQRLLPRDAIRELVNHHKKEFDPVMLKALIESISLYPVGTFVQINTGEIGQVISIHNKFPLRPVVYINMDSHGNLITERKIDLKQQPNLMIKKCMYEEALEELRQEQAHS